MTDWAGIALTVVVALDALRLRGRASALPRIGEVAGGPEAAPDESPVVFVPVKGLNWTPEAERRVSSYMRAQSLDVLDVWPDRVGVDTALALLSVVDVSKFRTQRLARGMSAMQCVAVRRSVLDRMRTANAELVARVEAGPVEPTDLLRLSQAAKRYACTSTALAALPGVLAAPEDPSRARACAEVVLGALWAPVSVARALWLVFLVSGAWTHGGPWLAALALWMSRPILALSNTSVVASELWARSVLRPVYEVRALLALWAPPGRFVERPTLAERVEAERPTYRRLLEGGLTPFFEPRASACPMCGGGALTGALDTPDLVMGKPGRFHVDRCTGCGHLFQNPRLSLTGLGFYYRDAYDGLGADQQELTLGGVQPVYEARARFVAAHAQPTLWLDVGGGSGHLCCVARDVFPACRFESVDLSEGVEEAQRRGWVDHAIRGLFPECATELSGRYDVVSMSHYLEHTLDPDAELASAATALKPGGLVFIELPDPATFVRRILGRFWFPWLQPQHLHFLSFEAVQARLVKHGFEPVAEVRGATHYPWDFALAPWLVAGTLLPAGDVPWRAEPPTQAQRIVRALGLAVTLPFMALGLVVDLLLLPFTRRPGGSNAFRILARKRVQPA
jgi:SAM-dependent methyltransferase